MCGCSKNKATSSNCSNITVNDYNVYKTYYQCVINNNLFVQVGLDESYINDQISKIDAAIPSKEANPSSCKNRNEENRWVSDIQNIVLNSSC